MNKIKAILVILLALSSPIIAQAKPNPTIKFSECFLKYDTMNGETEIILYNLSFTKKTKMSEERFQELLQQTRLALTNETDLVIWPEGATPGLFRYETNINTAIINLAREQKIYLVFGGADIVWDDPPTDGSERTNASHAAV